MRRSWVIGAAVTVVAGGVLVGLDAYLPSGPGPVTVLGVPGADGLPDDDAGEDGPGPVALRGGGVVLELEPYTLCWSTLTGGFCADGAPMEPVPEVGSPASVVVEGPTGGWRWDALGTVSTGDVEAACGRSYPFPVTVAPDGTVTVEPGGPPGLYDVRLSGWHERGDVHVAFRWRTTADGPLPSPGASVALVAVRRDAPDVPVTYGASLSVHDLASTPTTASATITVVDAAGVEASLELTAQTDGPAVGPCAPGSVNLDDIGGAAAEALVAQLGPGPWRHDVELVLDGVTYRASATYPRDTDEDHQPLMRLVFDPPLPGPDR